MPYSLDNPPKQAAKYSAKCQRAFVHAFNNVHAETGDEARSFAAGHAAAKRCEGANKAMTLPLTTFKVFIPSLTASRDGGGRRIIEGVGSSTIVDHHGDEITLAALTKAAKSAIGLTVFMNHEYRVPQDVFGQIEAARVINTKEIDPRTQKSIYDLGLRIPVVDDNEEAIKCYNMIEKKQARLGISVGAMIPEGGAEFVREGSKARLVVNDWEPVEFSMVGIPASPRSFVDYAVKALTGYFPTKGDRQSENPRFSIFMTKALDDLSGETLTEEQQAGLLEDPEEESESETEIEPVADPAVDPDGIIDAPDPELPEDVAKDRADYEFGDDHFGAETTLVAESWSSSYKNSLPDSAFACPSSRKYPHHSKSGAVDLPHLKAALSRVGDPSNDQCGKAHLEAHARKLGIGSDGPADHSPSDVGGRTTKAFDEALDLVASGSGQHPHAHLHEHEHQHGYSSGMTVHDHEHAHAHSHEHESDHEHADDMNDYQHNHGHEGDGNWTGPADHAHDESRDSTVTTKSRVTVWDSDKVIEVDTGRSKPKSGDDQSAQDTTPETAGGQSSSSAETAKSNLEIKVSATDIEPVKEAFGVAASTVENSGQLIKALTGQLAAARAENLMLKKREADVLGVAKQAIDGVNLLLAKLGETPVGRKTQYAEVVDDFDSVKGIYDESVLKLMRPKPDMTGR